jgi:predicted RNA-binding protein YlqC (UPF0109 family)
MAYTELVETLVKGVVDNPDAVKVTEDIEVGVRSFHVECDKEDVGKVIGKSGRVVSAIRCVVSAVASKERERAFVKVVTE